MYNKHRGALLLSLAVAGQLLTGSAAANNSDEIIVTANRLPESRFETLAATDLITREQIQSRMAGSLFELLGASSGIQTTRTGGDGSQTSLFMRGSNSDHTLVLIDGVKVNTASEGFARLEHIPTEQIERIEIVRGGQSSIHGADAIGGVIQIFTRQPADSAGLSGQMQGSLGSHASRRANASLDFGSNNTRAGINISHQQTDGIRPRNAPAPSARRSAYNNDALNLQLSHQPGENSSLQASYSFSESALDFDGGSSDNQHQNLSLGGNLSLSDNWHSQLRIGHFQDENHTGGSFPAFSRTRRSSVHWFNHLELDSDGDLAFGIDHDNDSLRYDSDSSVQTDTGRENTAAFVAYRQDLAAFSTNLSLRHDRNQQFGSKSTGRAALGYNIRDNLSLWYAYGTAFKAPNLIDLYVDFPQFWFYANPDLKPETATSHELALRGSSNTLQWSASLFQNDISNLISSNATFDSLTNIGRARIRGLELSGGVNLFDWQTDIALTLLDHEDRDNNQPLLRRPDELLSINVHRQWQQLSLNAHWQVRGAQADIDPVTFARSQVAGSGVLDLALDWRWSSQLSSQLKVGNVFDKRYQVVDGYNTYGRTALFATRFRF